MENNFAPGWIITSFTHTRVRRWDVRTWSWGRFNGILLMSWCCNELRPGGMLAWGEYIFHIDWTDSLRATRWTMVYWIVVPPRRLCPNVLTLWTFLHMILGISQLWLISQLKFSQRSWSEIILDYLGTINAHRGPCKTEARSSNKEESEVMMEQRETWRCFAVSFQDGGRSRDPRSAGLEAETGKGMDSPLGPLEWVWSCQHFGLGPMRSISDLWLPDCKGINLCCFQPLTML